MRMVVGDGKGVGDGGGLDERWRVVMGKGLRMGVVLNRDGSWERERG